jgi:hypothetical protein
LILCYNEVGGFADGGKFFEIVTSSRGND